MRPVPVDPEGASSNSDSSACYPLQELAQQVTAVAVVRCGQPKEEEGGIEQEKRGEGHRRRVQKDKLTTSSTSTLKRLSFFPTIYIQRRIPIDL